MALLGATDSVLSLIRVAPAAAGDYTVSVLNDAGSTESKVVKVSVIEPVRIVTQPNGVDAPLGDTVTLSIEAEGTEPINYFWLHNGNRVFNSTGNTLTLSELHPSNAGEYVVMVSNSGGQVTSAPANLSVKLPKGTYFVEDFDSLQFGPWVGEGIGDGTDWTATPPSGWEMLMGENHVPVAP